jgi:hypothetical protein
MGLPFCFDFDCGDNASAADLVQMEGLDLNATDGRMIGAALAEWE